MAVIGPQNRGIPTHITGQYTPPKKPLNAFGNLGIEGAGYATRNVQVPTPPPFTVPPAAPAVDFSTLVGSDPQYMREKALNENANQLALQQLAKQFAGTRQSAQDSANSHGALFSGAAVHAQNYAAQNYADQQAQQAQNYSTQGSNQLSTAWQRILNQLAGGA